MELITRKILKITQWNLCPADSYVIDQWPTGRSYAHCGAVEFHLGPLRSAPFTEDPHAECGLDESVVRQGSQHVDQQHSCVPRWRLGPVALPPALLFHPRHLNRRAMPLSRSRLYLPIPPRYRGKMMHHLPIIAIKKTFISTSRERNVDANTTLAVPIAISAAQCSIRALGDREQ